ncbi:MAG: cupredoxin domain-containing protein [Bacillota bacterium]
MDATSGPRRRRIRSSRARAMWVLLCFAVMAAVGLWGGPGSASSPRGAEREFVITARQFSFDPPRIYVNAGDHVTLRVRSLDITHGLYLDAYGINVKVPPMEEGIVRFVADRPGKLRYRCSVICGSLHPLMVGEIVVQPNRPYSVAGVVAVIVGFGGLAYVWWRKGA